MTQNRTYLAEVFSESTGWSVTADARRFTFINDDPPQVVVWTVTDAQLGSLIYAANMQSKHAGGTQSDDPAILWLVVAEAIGPFEGSRGQMQGTDMTIVE